MGNILQIGANLGIIVGLVLVGFQIRDANRIANTQFEYEAWGGAIRANEIILGDDFADSWTKAQCNSADLTAKDLVVVRAFLTREWLHNARVSRVHVAGYDQVEQDRTATKWGYSFLGNETSLRWWTMMMDGGDFLGTNLKLRDEINDLLSKLGQEHSKFHQTMLERQRKEVCT